MIKIVQYLPQFPLTCGKLKSRRFPSKGSTSPHILPDPVLTFNHYIIVSPEPEGVLIPQSRRPVYLQNEFMTLKRSIQWLN